MHRILTCSVILLIPTFAIAHPGGLDRQGGHVDRSTGIWHSHSGGGGGGGWFPFVVPVEPRKDPPSPEHRAARTAYRTAVRENDARRRHAAAQKEAADRVAAGVNDDEDRERRAAAKLKLAKDLLEKGHTAVAIKWLKEILQEFPETKAGQEAKTLLVKQGVNLTVWYWRLRGVYGILSVMGTAKIPIAP